MSPSCAVTIRVSGEIEMNNARANNISDARANWIFFIWIGSSGKTLEMILRGHTLIEVRKKSNAAEGTEPTRGIERMRKPARHRERFRTIILGLASHAKK